MESGIRENKPCFLEDEKCHLIMYLPESKAEGKGYELCKICQMFKLRREIQRLRITGMQP